MPLISPHWLDDDLHENRYKYAASLSPSSKVAPVPPTNTTTNNRPTPSIESRYWKLSSSRLTCLDTHESEPLLAVGLRASNSNLLIFEHTHIHTEKSVLTHHQTITLPNTFIGKIQWMPRHVHHHELAQLLATGHLSSISLIKLSDPYSSNDPAEIVVKLCHSSQRKQRRLLHMAFTHRSPHLIALAGGRFFDWDLSRVDKPSEDLVFARRSSKLSHVTTFDVAPTDDHIILTGGDRGIAMRDLRSVDFALQPSQSSSVPTFKQCVTSCLWSPTNVYQVASASTDNTVRVWDIRSNMPLFEFTGHKSDIMSIRWNSAGSSILSASLDGSLRSWSFAENPDYVSLSPTYYSDSDSPPPLDLSSPTSSDSLSPPRMNCRTASASTCDSAASFVSSSFTNPSRNSHKCNVYCQTRPSVVVPQRDLGFYVHQSTSYPSCAMVYAPEKKFVDAAFSNSRPFTNEVMSIDTSGFLGIHLKARHQLQTI